MGNYNSLLLLALLIIFVSSVYSVNVSSGSIYSFSISHIQQSSYWAGFYGEVVVSSSSYYSLSVESGTITKQDMQALDPGCSDYVLHIIASNSSTISGHLIPGDISILDNIINSSENASTMFNYLHNYSLSSSLGGTIEAPTVVLNNSYSNNVFLEGYFNDQQGNLVFVTEVYSDVIGWNNETMDYELMLPNNRTTWNYWAYVDVNDNCNASSSTNNDEHSLYIEPISTKHMQVYSSISFPVIVLNNGDYDEHNIYLTFNCPSQLSCNNYYLGDFLLGESKEINVSINSTLAGTYIVEITATSNKASFSREFFVVVENECYSDDQCSGHCNNGVCEDDYDVGNSCNRDEECSSGVCVDHVCSQCQVDDDCASDQICSNGFCEDLSVSCGYIANHTIYPYECCEDEDCSVNQYCSNNVCVDDYLNVTLVNGSLVENESAVFLVTDHEGNPVVNAFVETEYGSAYTDENGYATISFSYSGNVFVEKQGYGRVVKQYNVIKLAKIDFPSTVYVGQEYNGRVLDTRNNLIYNVLITYETNSLFTEDGTFRIEFDKEGTYILEGEKEGYFIYPKTVIALNPQCCALLSLITICNNALIIIHIVTMLLLFYITYRLIILYNIINDRDIDKTTSYLLYSLAYTIAPLALIFFLSYCIIVNISILQLIFSTILYVYYYFTNGRNKRRFKKG